MLYLLDSNILINANRDYYPIEDVPEYWEWLLYMASSGKVKIPREIYEELLKGNKQSDSLVLWLKQHKSNLELKEQAAVSSVRTVTISGYARHIKDDQIGTIGADSFLISYAYNRSDQCIVTAEVSSPARKDHNRKIPDVCKTFDIKCIAPFEFNRQLQFNTSWKGKILSNEEFDTDKSFYKELVNP